MASVKLYPIYGAAAGLLRLAVDVAFPPGCPSCRTRVDAPGNFCGECFTKLRMITPPLCGSCGVPFPYALGEAAQCVECLEKAPRFDRARSVMVYDKVSAPLVSALKFRDQWAGLPRYVAMMRASGNELLEQADLLVPVPLHWRRLMGRRYNQSALLAYELARLSGKPCLANLLKRTRYTTPQMRLPRAKRLKNVQGAFAVAAGAALHGKKILLVDDVVTTGATVEACAVALKQAGAAQVDVLSLARTVKE